MSFLFMRIAVADFNRWKQTFDQDAETRRANRSARWRVFRNSVNPGDVWVLLEWDDQVQAHLFANSDGMIDELIRAGVANQPDVWFLDETTTPAF